MSDTNFSGSTWVSAFARRRSSKLGSLLAASGKVKGAIQAKAAKIVKVIDSPVKTSVAEVDALVGDMPIQPYFVMDDLERRALLSVTVNTVSKTDITADNAANSTSPAGGKFTQLGEFKITESATKDEFQDGTLVINAPTGWVFDSSATASDIVKDSTGFTSLTASITSSQLIIVMDVNGNSKQDVLSIKNLPVKASDGANLSQGTIYVDAASIDVAGITEGAAGTTLATVGQKVGNLALMSVVLPGQKFDDTDSIGTSGVIGTPSTVTPGSPFSITLVETDSSITSMRVKTATTTSHSRDPLAALPIPPKPSWSMAWERLP